MVATSVGTLATADVDVRAKLDNFERDMQAVQARLQTFDQGANTASQSAKKFETSTGAAAAAASAFGTGLGKLEDVIGKLTAADQKATAAIKDWIAANDNATKSAEESKKATDAHSEATKSHAKSFLQSAEHLLKIVSLIKLGSAIAYAASPQFKAVADHVLGIGKSAIDAAPSMGKFGESVSSVAEKAKPFMKVGGLFDLVGIATTAPLAAAGMLTLSGAARQVVKEEVTQGVKGIVKSLEVVAPAALAAGRGIISALGPVLTFVTKIGGPIVAIVLALKGLVELFKLGKDAVDELTTAAEKMGGAMSAENFKKYTNAVLGFKLKTDDAAAALKKLHDISQEQLGGSQLDKALDEQAKAGNITNKSLMDQVKNALTLEERFGALARLMTDMSQKGYRLAALKLGETFLPPEVMAQLRIMPDLMEQWVKKAEKGSKIDIVNEKNTVRAIELKAQMDEAYEILHQKWELDVLPKLTAWGLEFYAIWVKIVSVAASFVGVIGEILSAIGDVLGPALESVVDAFLAGLSAGWKQLKGTMDDVREGVRILNDLVEPIVNWFRQWEVAIKSIVPNIKSASTEFGNWTKWLKEAGDWGKALAEYINSWIESLGIVFGWVDKIVRRIPGMGTGYAATVGAVKSLLKVEDETGPSTSEADERTLKYAEGIEKLKIAAQDATAKLRGMGQAVAVNNSVLKDRSQIFKDDGWDKEIQRLSRHIALQEAEATSVGKGVGALAELRVKMQAYEFAAQKGIVITEKMDEQLDRLAMRAAAAAETLAKAKLQFEMKMEGRTMFLTDTDVAIANKLKEIYPQMANSAGEMAKALNSAEANQLRLLAYVKEAKDLMVGFATEIYTGLVGGLRQGLSFAQAFAQAMQKALQSLVDKLIEMAIRFALLKAMGSIFGGGEEAVAGITAGAAKLAAAGAAVSAELTTGMTTASGLLTAAGEALAATMVSAASSAAAILTAAEAPMIAVGLAHTGGVIGMDKLATRAVPADAFRAAPRFRGGGVVAPDEVPIIAHRNEEVLRRDDPRHRLNLRNSGAAPPAASGTVITVNFTHQGTLTTQQVKDHANLLAKQIAQVQGRTPSIRPRW